MNVPKLKEAALGYGGRIDGVHGMDKIQLVRVLKEINDIPLQENKRTSNIDRASIKEKIKTLKKERDQYLETKDPEKLKRTRNKIIPEKTITDNIDVSKIILLSKSLL